MGDDGAVRRRRLPQRPRRVHAALRSQGGDPRHRGARAGVATDHQRAHLHRRRHRDGLPRRGDPDGHGDDRVPPHDAGGQGLPDHRGRPRGGRAPAEREGRALHGAATRPTRWSWQSRDVVSRAEQTEINHRPRVPRRHGRARHHRCPPQAHPRGAARDRAGGPGLRGRGHHQESRSTSSPATTTRWAASRPTSGAAPTSKA